MDIAHTSQTPALLKFGRHAVGLALFSLLSPMVYIHPTPVAWWMTMWVGAIIASAVIYGVYALFFTQRAKAAWPGSFIMLAWVLVGLMVIGGWSIYNSAREKSSERGASQEWLEKGSRIVEPQPAATTNDSSPYPGLKPFTGKLDGE